MSYAGTLTMPNNYFVMDQDEMMYLEGGGTFTLKMNKAAVTFILQTAGTATLAAITVAMGATGIGAIVSTAVCSLIYNWMVDTIVQPQAINKSWTAAWIPTKTFTWNR